MRRNMGIQNETGMTLVEILAALIIVSLIIISFLTVFGQTARQNKTSEQTINATYIAQKHMEEIYKISRREKSFEDGILQLPSENNSYSLENKSNKIYTLTHKENALYETEIILTRPSVGKKDGTLLVKVYEISEHKKLKAQMETILLWGDD